MNPMKALQPNKTPVQQWTNKASTPKNDNSVLKPSATSFLSRHSKVEEQFKNKQTSIESKKEESSKSQSRPTVPESTIQSLKVQRPNTGSFKEKTSSLKAQTLNPSSIQQLLKEAPKLQDMQKQNEMKLNQPSQQRYQSGTRVEI